MLPCALTIAGSDPSGGAGIQADLKTFHQGGVYGAAALTLLTVQNTCGVREVLLLEPDFVARQVRAVLEDLPVRAVKTGALGNAGIAQAVARELDGRALLLVVDPVMVSKHGAALLDPVQARGIRENLFARADLLTPNLPEASVLLGWEVSTLVAMETAARELRELCGCRAVLVKGGHLEQAAVDVLWDGKTMQSFEGPRVDSVHTHGTGCTYAAAITARLARGLPLAQAVGQARTWLQKAIETAPGLGRGQGPVNHFA